MTTVSDDFNRADGGLGSDWRSYASGAATGAKIASNQVGAVTPPWGGDYLVAYQTTTFGDTADVFAQITCKATESTDAIIGPAVRVDPTTGAAYGLWWFSGGFSLRRNGTQVQYTATAIAVNDVLKLTCERVGSDDVLKVWLNGAQIGTTYTDTSPWSGATMVGMQFGYPDATGRIDDWSGGDYSAGGGSVYVPRRSMMGVG